MGPLLARLKVSTTSLGDICLRPSSVATHRCDALYRIAKVATEPWYYRDQLTNRNGLSRYRSKPSGFLRTIYNWKRGEYEDLRREVWAVKCY